MSQTGLPSTAALESSLLEALSALPMAATAVGAQSVSVFVLENHSLIRMLFGWPEFSRERGGALHLRSELYNSLETLNGSVPADSPLAQFLTSVCRPSAASFLVFPWGISRLTVIVAFGFASRLPPGACLPQEASGTVHLAQITTWCVHEICRLRSELGVANDRLGKRKLVERAKGLLQTERGFDEPQAYEYMRKLSRQRRVRMADIAKDLLRTSDARSPDISP